MFCASATKIRIFLRILAVGMCFVFFAGSIFPVTAFASRSNAGGGDGAKIDYGKIGKDVAIAVVPAAVGSVIGPALSAASPVEATSTLNAGWFMTKVYQTYDMVKEVLYSPITLVNAATNSQIGFSAIQAATKLKPWAQAAVSIKDVSTIASAAAKGYAVWVAKTQLTKGLSAAGRYYGWNPRSTFLLSAITTGAAGGMINPQGALGDSLGRGSSNALTGAFVGSMGGAASAGAVLAIDGNRIEKGKSPGILAQSAGTFAGIYGTSLARTLISPNTYTTHMEEWGKDKNGDFVNSKTGERLRNGPTLTTEEMRADLQKNYGEIGDMGMEIDYSNVPAGKIAAGYQAAGNAIKSIDDVTGVTAFNNAYNKKMDLSSAKKFLGNAEDNGIRVMLSDSQINTIMDSSISPDQNTYWAPGMGVSGGQIFGRLAFKPLLDAGDSLPTIAGNALSGLATKKMNKEWKMVSGGVFDSVINPLLDNAATIFYAKPSLWGNIETKLGYAPEAQYQRDELMKKAATRENIDKFNEAVGSISQETLDKCRGQGCSVVDLGLDKLLSYEQAQIVLGAFVDKVKNSKEPITTLEAKVLLSGDYLDVAKNEPTISGALGMVAGDSIRSALPIELANGAIDVGVNKVMNNDNALSHLGGVAVASAVKGMATNMYTDYLYNKQFNAFVKDGVIPDETITGYNMQAQDAILTAQIKGRLPPPAEDKYIDIKEVKYAANPQDESMNPEEVEQLANNLKVKANLQEKGDLINNFNGLKDSLQKSLQGNLDPKVQGDLMKLSGINQYFKLVDDPTAGPKIKVAQDTTISAGYDILVKFQGKTLVNPGGLKKDTLYTVHNGEASPAGYYTLNGKPVKKVAFLPEKVSIGKSIFGNVGQAMYELAWRTSSMDMPKTTGGRMSPYAWFSYQQSSNALANSAAQNGMSNTMKSQFISNAKEIMGKRALMTLAETPLGHSAEWWSLGLSPTISIKNYGNKSYTEAYIMRTDLDQAQQVFYPTWPYYKLTAVPADPFSVFLRNKFDLSTKGDQPIPKLDNSNNQIILPKTAQ